MKTTKSTKIKKQTNDMARANDFIGEEHGTVAGAGRAGACFL